MRKITAAEIQRIRNDLNLTQEEMAYKIGVAHSTIHRWESGKTRPSKMAIRILNELRNEVYDQRL